MYKNYYYLKLIFFILPRIASILFECVYYMYTILCVCSYENPDIALNCGVMLRECIKHEPLAKLILESDDFFLFYKYVEVSTFDIASDAFSTFKVSTA